MPSKFRDLVAARLLKYLRVISNRYIVTVDIGVENNTVVDSIKIYDMDHSASRVDMWFVQDHIVLRQVGWVGKRRDLAHVIIMEWDLADPKCDFSLEFLACLVVAALW